MTPGLEHAADRAPRHSVQRLVGHSSIPFWSTLHSSTRKDARHTTAQDDEITLRLHRYLVAQFRVVQYLAAGVASGTVWKSDEVVTATQRVSVDHVIVCVAYLLGFCDGDTACHRSKHRSKLGSLPVTPTILPLGHCVLMRIEIRDNGRALNQRADKNQSGEEVRLSNQLSNAESDANPLRKYLTCGPLEWGQSLRVPARPSGNLRIRLHRPANDAVEPKHGLKPKVGLIVGREYWRNFSTLYHTRSLTANK